MSNASHDRYRENVAGRASIADTPELVAYYGELEQFAAGALPDRGQQDRAVAAEVRIGAHDLALSGLASVCGPFRRSSSRPSRRAAESST